MTKIETDRDFRIGWEILCTFKNSQFESGGDIEHRMKCITELKRNLRQYASRGTAVDVGMGFMCERRIVKDYGIDGYVELVSIPKVFDTLEDNAEGGPGAETFFKSFLKIHTRPSMYDCTGQAFTNWYKLFKRHGQFWAYHGVGVDV